MHLGNLVLYGITFLPQECHIDNHPETENLRQQRIRVYHTTDVTHQDDCQNIIIYKLKSYLIIDNATEEDSGEYTLEVTTTYPGFTPITLIRSVQSTISMCFSVGFMLPYV